MQKLSFLFLLFFSLGFLSCATMGEKGNGITKVETRNLNNFNEIKLNGAFEVILEEGNNLNCRIEAEENLIPYIRTRISGEKLTIDSEKPISPTKPIRVIVSYNSLSSIEVSGSGDIKGNSLLRSSNLDLEITGSGNINLQVNVMELTSEIAGSGNIEITGLAESNKIHITGSGKVLANGLKTLRSYVDITGSGTCKIDASELMDIDITGSGDVFYAGDPKRVNQKITGSGHLRRI